MKHTYCLSKFTVLENYKEYKDEKGVLRWIINEEANHLLDEKFKEQKVYNPLEETKELYMELNKINFKDPNSLPKFISTYGLPIGKNIDAGNKEIKALYRMSILEFLKNFIPFKEIINLWQAIQDDDQVKLENTRKIFSLNAADAQLKIFQEHKQYILEKSDLEIDLFQKTDGPFTDEEFKIWVNMKDMDLKDIAKSYITVLLNKQSFGHIKTTLVDVPCVKKGKTVNEKKIVDAVSFNNLFEVAFYQLRQSIFNEMKLKRCEHCGYPFEATHERQRFCSPLFGRKRSTCENTYNQRLKRQRQKQ
jgi:hypothetical protein